MNEVDYKPNSHKFKAKQGEDGERKIQKVVSGPVKVKKNDARRFADLFISDDAKSIKSHVIMDVLVPAIKNTILDIIIDSAKMFLGGGKSSGRTVGSKVSYRNYYDRKEDRYSSSDNKVRSRFDYDEIIFDNRGEAEAVRDQMIEVIDKYGFVTVADLYDMVELQQPYTSNKYGWTSLANAEVVRIREGYVIKLPKARPIDD